MKLIYISNEKIVKIIINIKMKRKHNSCSIEIKYKSVIDIVTTKLQIKSACSYITSHF